MHPIFQHRPSRKLWFGLLSAGVVIGIIGALNVLINGHAHVYNVTREIPWGILIATYVFLVVSSTGLCLVSSLGHVFGIEKFEFIGKRAIILAIITLLCGFGTIGMEINHPIRLGIYAIISPNFSSAIWWMGTLYGLYLVLLSGELYFLMKGMHKGAFALGMAGFIAAISAHSNLGAVFGLLEARPFWYGSFLPIYFILSALVSGGAIVSMIVYFNHKESGTPMPQKYEDFMGTLGKLQALFLTILIFFVIWKIIPAVYGHPPEKFEATMATLTGPLAFNFWFFEVLLGMLIPVVILLNPRTRTPGGVMWAGLLSTFGIFFMRFDLVVAGQLVSMREGAADLTNGLLSYVPSITELAIVIGAISLCLFLYTLAEHLLPLDVEEDH
ncbi:MAG: polysulfide reductase [Desulfuromonadales bacterium GWD2_61_12]|nr:MAG: polysulfide reductase [Desulfuromonadales bacterium GWC2_61_20]OGR36910.1 MAG: polysulfide reductase [Desulfuromonadales bacterium GWD2_61_12]HAD05154.1 polysulfide reductase [Desulfuromonas sp.]HBT83301.1 polysulfide reductase [Desulfuromonas sp.]